MRKHLSVVALLAISCSAEAQPGTELDAVFNGDMLGTNLRYFESVAGIARESWGDQHTYIVDGCQVVAEAPGGSITSLDLDINERCQVDLTSFLGESFAPDISRPLTFGNFMEHAGEGFYFYSDCLTRCGNAFDPSVYAYWEGPRAAGFINMKLGVELISGEASDAASQWADVMYQQRGEDYVIDTEFNCDRAFDDVAAQLLYNVEITQLTLGNVAGARCE